MNISEYEYPGPEFYYYKLGRGGRKSYYGKINNQRISVNNIHSEYIPDIRPDLYAKVCDIENLTGKKNHLIYKLSQMNGIFEDYDVDLKEKGKYQQLYETQKSTNNYYYKIMVNGRKMYYKFSDNKNISKSRIAEEALNEIPMNIYFMVKDYETLQQDINTIEFQIQSLNEEISATGKTESEIKENHELEIQELTRILNLNITNFTEYIFDEEDFIILLRSLNIRDTQQNPENKSVNQNEKIISHKDEETDFKEITCNVCMVNKKAVSINCGHLYCAGCYNRLIKEFNPKCPNCRETITNGQLIYL